MAEVTGVSIRKVDNKFAITGLRGDSVVVDKVVVDDFDIHGKVSFTRREGKAMSLVECKGTVEIFEDNDGRRFGTLVCRE